tara:strand:+ start:115 stop:489 length:375 start_codon:yes stop_codon:yes gene_type:complete
MYIVHDKINKEYGLLKKTPFIDVMKTSFKSYNKDHHKLTAEHVFFNPNFVHETDEEIENSVNENFKGDKDTANIGVPVVYFYDKDKKVYDTAMYTSEPAKKRYKIIKEIKGLNDFFTYTMKKNK